MRGAGSTARSSFGASAHASRATIADAERAKTRAQIGAPARARPSFGRKNRKRAKPKARGQPPRKRLWSALRTPSIGAHRWAAVGMAHFAGQTTGPESTSGSALSRSDRSDFQLTALT